MKRVPELLLLVLLISSCVATAQDSLRGSNGPFRKGWDVLRYDLDIGVNLSERSIMGQNRILFRATEVGVQKLQIDLQEPMRLRGVSLTEGKTAVESSFSSSKNAYWINLPTALQKGKTYTLYCDFYGTPREAKNPPWDGGFVWAKSKSGKPWVAVACQGDGASLWFPCKDFQADEPDSGSTIRIRNTAGLPVVSNGQLISGTLTKDPVWQVKSAINPYNITFYIGDYVGWTDTFNGASGKLPLSFYALRENEAKARKQFAVVRQMLRCYEETVGPYPFYADGYKLVEAPYLGMEHQSAIAYGNEYQMGYRGLDRSGTGVGKTFDYIIIHESGHEWFGNSITAADVADNWIHEGFTTYLENVFVECASGPKAAKKYLLGERRNIRNDQPIIGRYGVFDEGSGDKYDKGATIVGMLRAMHPDDAAFWASFRKFYARFAHSTVTSAQVESWWSTALNRDLKPFFDLYLRSTMIPGLEFRKENGQQEVRLTDVGNGFSLPLFYDASGKPLEVSNVWQAIGKKRDPRPEFLIKN
ncbi:MAG: M1 family peptidase [Sphingobacteriales bacterium]|nr:MAG: M1 family peptidase [Sphingobacteriales bacterium]